MEMEKTDQQTRAVAEELREKPSCDHDEKPSAYSSFSAPSDDPTGKQNVATLTIETGFADCGASDRESASRPHNANTGQSGWRTLLRVGPLSGIFGMFLAIASIFAALGVLVESDKEAVDKWSAPPSTYLAIFTAVANLSVRYAAINGVVIAWWCRASRSEGATLAKLHNTWVSGSSLFQAIGSGRNIGLVGLATIFSTLVVIDGPLLQRASTVRQAPWVDEVVHLNVSMAQELSRFWGGSVAQTAGGANTVDHWSYSFNDTIPTGTNGTTSNFVYPEAGFSNMIPELGELIKQNAPLDGVVHGCEDSCTAKIRAPALAPVACFSELIPVNYLTVAYIKNDPVESGATPSLDADLFLISTSLSVTGAREAFNLVTGYYDGRNCVGHLNVTACTLESAVGEYTVDISNGKATFVDAENPVIIALANNSAPAGNSFQDYTDGLPSTLAAIVEIAWERFEVVVSVFREKNGEINAATTGPGTIAARESEVPDDAGCTNYADPHPFMMKNLNTMMVWAGSVSASQNASTQAELESQMDPGRPMERKVKGLRTGTHAVFHAEYEYFAAAAVVELICILLIAPTYWGWWKLGRDVSFSPLEIAKAFRSPLLAGYNSNSRAREIAKDGRDTRLRYGAVDVDTGRRMSELAFASPVSVSNVTRDTHLA